MDVGQALGLPDWLSEANVEHLAYFRQDLYVLKQPFFSSFVFACVCGPVAEGSCLFACTEVLDERCEGVWEAISTCNGVEVRHICGCRARAHICTEEIHKPKDKVRLQSGTQQKLSAPAEIKSLRACTRVCVCVCVCVCVRGSARNCRGSACNASCCCGLRMAFKKCSRVATQTQLIPTNASTRPSLCTADLDVFGRHFEEMSRNVIENDAAVRVLAVLVALTARVVRPVVAGHTGTAAA